MIVKKYIKRKKKVKQFKLKKKNRPRVGISGNVKAIVNKKN